VKLLIVYFSLSGNNRLLAQQLGARLDARVVEVTEARKRGTVTILLDMVLKRRPKILPLQASAGDYDHVLFAAPLWDMWIAFPMASAIRQMAHTLPKYSFVSFCGYERPGQPAHVTDELTTLVGRAPEQVWELHVSDLFPPEQKNKVTVVTPHRVTPVELAHYETRLDEIVAYFTHAH
jgi:hypothetical protein